MSDANRAKRQTSDQALATALPPLPLPPDDVRADVKRGLTYVLRETGGRWLAPLLAWLLAPSLQRARARLAGELATQVNWISELHLRARIRTTESVLSDSWCVILGPDLGARTAIDRGALLVASALEMHDVIASGKLPQEYEGEHPLDMEQYQRLFSWGLRAKDDDTPTRATGRHVLVLVRRRFFAVDVVGASGVRSVDGWREALRAIVELTAKDGPSDDTPAGVTAGDRPEWRALAADLYETNEATMDAVDEALFTLALDVDDEVADLDGFGVKAYSAGFRNRWYDHGLQLVVSADGNAAVIGCFRAGAEGRVAGLFCLALGQRAIHHALPQKTDAPADVAAKTGVHELTWQMSEGQRAARDAITETVRSRLTTEGRREWIEGLGLGAFKKLGIKPDAGFHLALHLALRDPRVLALGRGVVREMIDMRRYQAGHVRTFIPPTAAAEAFRVALERGADRAELREKLAAAAVAHTRAIDAEKELSTESGYGAEMLAYLGRAAAPWPRRLLQVALAYGLKTPGTFPLMTSNIRYAHFCEYHGPMGYVALTHFLQLYVVMSEGPAMLTFQTGRGLEEAPKLIAAALRDVAAKLAKLS